MVVIFLHRLLYYYQCKSKIEIISLLTRYLLQQIASVAPTNDRILQQLGIQSNLFVPITSSIGLVEAT